MPTYEYECTKCSHRFEVFQKVDAVPRKRCPSCKSKVRRIISGGAGIIFKGSGFYATDYKKRTPVNSSCKGCSKSAGKESGSSKETCPVKNNNPSD